MNKKELIESVASKTGFTKTDIKSAVDALFDTVTDTITAGDKVSITGFGSFETVDVAARQGHNPQTGETMTIAAHKKVKFKPGKSLKDEVNL